MTPRLGKRAIAALLAAALMAPALGGCGGGGGSNDEQQVRQAATAFFDALHARDFKKVCSLFSVTVLRAIPHSDKGGCEKALAKVSRAQTDAIVKVGDVRVRADRAAVTVAVSRPGQPEASIEVLLVKESGIWKVASRI